MMPVHSWASYIPELLDRSLPNIYMMYRVSQKSNPPKVTNNILAYAKLFLAKFCQVIGNLYPHMYTKSGELYAKI